MQPGFRARGEYALSVLALGALLAPLTTAQDSVSKLSGVANSDALDPYNTSDVRNDYVVDLTPFTTSWGTQFGIAPIVKSSQPDTTGNFNSLVSSQAISRTSLSSATFDGTSYGVWTTPGEGVNSNAALNDVPSTVTPAGAAEQFSAAFSEFGNGYNSVITAIVRHEASDPSRLYVSRIASIINGSAFGESCSSMGLGSVDAEGHTYFRGDGFGAIPCNSAPGSLSGDNILRVDAAARSTSALNFLDNSGGSDAAATDWLIMNSTTTHSTPSAVPADLAGRPVYSGANFNGEYVYESAAGVTTTTTSHRTPAPDQRGVVSFGLPTFLGGVGTAAMLGKDSNDETRRLLIWGVDGNGAVTGTRNDIFFTATQTITDNDDGHVFGDDTTYPSTPDIDEPLWHTGASSFRGGNGQVAVGQDQSGMVLVSTALNLDDTSIQPAGMFGILNPIAAIAVAKLDPNNASALDWTLAGYTGSNTDGVNGKDILDGPGGSVIGRMATLDQATGGTVLGPSVSPPMIDSVGNVWFISVVEIFAQGGGPSDFDNALVRAVYDRVNFSYELELVLQMGDIFAGQNSGRNYRVDFINVSAAAGGPTPATTFSGNIIQNALNNVPTSPLATSDASTLGGIVLTADLTYDANNDGMFTPVTGVGGDPTSTDQEYQALLYIGALAAQGPQSFCDNSDGSLAFCPCAQPGANDTGCDSPIPPMQGGGLTGGIRLDVVSQQTFPTNRMTLAGSGFPPLSAPTAIVIRATGLDVSSPVVFGDGLRCIGVPLIRLGATIGVSGSSTHTIGHGTMAGTGDFYYQLWFRSTPASFCDPTQAFNLSNGQEVDW